MKLLVRLVGSNGPAIVRSGFGLSISQRFREKLLGCGFDNPVSRRGSAVADGRRA